MKICASPLVESIVSVGDAFCNKTLPVLPIENKVESVEDLMAKRSAD